MNRKKLLLIAVIAALVLTFIGLDGHQLLTLANLQQHQATLTPYATYVERGAGLERCPNCHNERIARTPRRKSGPAMFHCRRCGYLASIDTVNQVRHWLGQTPA